ncbi:glycine betaine ABC transporter substrate-binding protein, partial [Streptococcus ferus]
MKKKIYWLMLSAVLSLLTLSGCNLLQSNQFSTIKIASMNTTESSIMANMIAELIEHETSYKTTLISNLGSSSVA